MPRTLVIPPGLRPIEAEMLGRDRVVKPPPRVIIEPARDGWWNAQAGAGLGQIFNGLLPPENGIIPILGIDRRGPPEHVTVALSRSDDESAPGTNADVICQVQYGLGGATDTFELDWCTGVQFTIPCVTIRVSAVAVRGEPFAPYAARRVIVSAAVAKGEAVSRPPTRTIVGTFPTLTAGQAAVPDFAREVSLAGVQVAGTVYDANTVIDFLSAGGVVLARYTGLDLTAGVRAPVPGQATSFILTNASPATRTLNAIFSLGL